MRPTFPFSHHFSLTRRYLSCKYEPGTLRRTRIYVNAAFARLSGVHQEEMVARCVGSSLRP